MNTDNQQNTLEYHNVQVGDVVGYTRYDITVPRTITDISPYYKAEGITVSTSPYWTVISCASTKPQGNRFWLCRVASGSKIIKP